METQTIQTHDGTSWFKKHKDDCTFYEKHKHISRKGYYLRLYRHNQTKFKVSMFKLKLTDPNMWDEVWEHINTCYVKEQQ